MDQSVPRYLSGFLRAALVVSAIVALATPALATPGGDFVQLRDGVVIDAERGLAYVMKPSGGLAAINLDNGRAEWGTDAAARPLAMSKGMLLAQAEGAPGSGLRIVSLDPSAKGAVVERAEVALPSGVRGTINDGWRTKIRVAATAQNGAAVITWKSTEALSKAAIPGPNEGRAPGIGAPPAATAPKLMRAHEGAARLDMAAGRSIAIPTKGLNTVPTGLRQLPTKTRNDVAGREFLSADGRHVLVSSRLDKSTPAATFRWTLFDKATGERLGSLDHFAAAAPFVVVGKQVVFEVQGGLAPTGFDDAPFAQKSLALHAVDLLSGTPVWKVALRDVSFQGPFPP